jgi:hypothetical protein
MGTYGAAQADSGNYWWVRIMPAVTAGKNDIYENSQRPQFLHVRDADI